MDLGRDGFLIARFRLDRLPEQEPLHTREQPDEDPAFATSTVTRRVRDTALSRELKAMYDQQCQVCDFAIPGYDGRTYSEGAHVRPLGRPHLGADKRDNLLCLCPNHHTQLDLGGMVVLDDMSIANSRTLEPFAELTFRTHHSLAIGNVSYHRQLWASKAT
jgi:putative restriction endonuclease